MAVRCTFGLANKFLPDSLDSVLLLHGQRDGKVSSNCKRNGARSKPAGIDTITGPQYMCIEIPKSPVTACHSRLSCFYLQLGEKNPPLKDLVLSCQARKTYAGVSC